MAQLTIYLPEELERKVRERAKQQGKSVSAFLAEIARQAVEPDAWSEAFLELYGSWEGDFPEPTDQPPEEREPL